MDRTMMNWHLQLYNLHNQLADGHIHAGNIQRQIAQVNYQMAMYHQGMSRQPMQPDMPMAPMMPRDAMFGDYGNGNYRHS